MGDERTELEKQLTPEESAIMRPFATPRPGGSYGYGYGNEPAGGIHLREVMRTILTSPEFFAPEAYRAKVKTPFEFIVSAVRAQAGKSATVIGSGGRARRPPPL